MHITFSHFFKVSGNKVPEVTLIFWLIKMMSTTVGETGADLLTFKLHWGLTNTSICMGALFFMTVAAQLYSRRYIPWLYWLTVVLVSVFGTLITDNLTDQLDVPLSISTCVFGVLLVATFAIWRSSEKTLSILEINSLKREIFYWLAVLTTFALGTAAGDWLSEGLHLGYALSAVLFGAAIILVVIAHYAFGVSSVTTFWVAYVLTRPLGASCGDLLSKSSRYGGFGVGTVNTSIVFAILILGLIAYLTRLQARDALSA